MQQPLSLSLLLLRLSVFLVMMMWTLDKFINPGHTSKVLEIFYKLPALSHSISLALGIAQALLIVAFVAGFKKRISYGAVLLMHLLSTVVSYKQYFDPWSGANLLFFAAFPMLAALIALYLMRDADTMLSVDK